jgi:hypothetical protein
MPMAIRRIGRGLSRARVLALLALALSAPACDETPAHPATSAPKTFSTLAKVDAYPLYVMRDYEDYHFDEYLMRGLGAGRERAPGPAPADGEAPWACTTFAALGGGEYVLGRNFDWYHHAALLLCTAPSGGHASVSMVDLSYVHFVPDDDSPANLERLLAAPYYPFDGMNECGLAVGMMAVPDAAGGGDPGKVTIGSLDAIRLMLDYAASIGEAVELLGRYNVDFTGGPPVHYLVSDSTRCSAVIEFVDDSMRVIRNDAPWQVATNFTITGYPFDASPSGCWRYNQASHVLKDADGVLTWGAAMDLLASVSQSITMWSVVYGGSSGDIRIAMGRGYGNVHSFNVKTLESL